MENYSQIFYRARDERIFPGERYSFDFDYRPEENKEHRLFFTGEVETFYWWKSEYCSTAVYKRVTDSLVRGRVDAYGLKMEGADYPVLAFRKIVWKPEVGYLRLRDNDENWTYGVTVSAKNVCVKPDGYLRLCLEIRKKREGMFNRHTSYLPDEVVRVDLEEGSYDLKTIGGSLVLPDDEIANVQFILEGENFEGEVVFEAPYLTSSNGYNVMAPFGPDATMYHSLFNWFGVNLSRTEWPEMQILLNGREVFCDEFFERCHRYSEKEISLPEGVLQEGRNRLEFHLISDWNGALPYRIHEVGIVSEDRHSFDVVSCPEVAVCGKEFSLLLDLSAPCTLQVQSDAKPTSPLRFAEGGLQALRFLCNELRNDLDITLTDGIVTHTVRVKRVIERAEDNVITGTGDLIYVNQADEDTKNYFKWYMQNRVGNLLTIRPTYRWSGTRKLNGPMWKRFVTLMNALGMKYSHMLDGREPQGYCANPSIAELSIETGEPSGFLGRQLHERDGAYCYWGDYSNPGDFWNNNAYYDAELYFDQLHRQRHYDPAHAGCEFYPEDFFDDGKRYWLCHDPNLPADMEAQAKGVLKSLSSIRKGSTRHTGPSIFFKYFCMAGYDWIGAETMDSPTEFLLAALRGAAEAFGVKTVGVHHALQWSSSPHDDPKRFERYRLALYVSWMQGAHEHNTEEGLWHMEEYFEAHHRHGNGCRGHLKMQQDFFRYVSSHSRQGRLRARVGLLHGRYDGAPCFGGAVWGRRKYHGFNDKFDAEMSWHIPRLSFYPHGINGFGATKHKCKNDGPIGLVSPNPRGCFNIIPVEKDWGDYPFLCFFGYNKAEKEDLDRLLKRVEEGSTLMLTLSHLSEATDRAAVEGYRPAFFAHPIWEAMGFEELPICKEASLGGQSLPVGENLKARETEILLKTDEGLPLAVEKKVGKGSIVVFNTLYYPANPAIKEAYTKEFERRSDAVHQQDRVFCKVGDEVQAVIYDRPDGAQEIYFIAVDWWNDPETLRKATLCIDGAEYEVSLPLGVMKKALVKDGRALLCQSESADVLRFTEKGFVAQGEGEEELWLFAEGKTSCLKLNFSEKPQLEVSL